MTRKISWDMRMKDPKELAAYYEREDKRIANRIAGRPVNFGIIINRQMPVVRKNRKIRRHVSGVVEKTVRAPRHWPTQEERHKGRLSRYKLTEQQLSTMIEDQNGSCAICRKEFYSGVFVVDHCHKILKVRGLLCRQCNSGLGMFHDSPDKIHAAALYIEKHQEESK